MSVASGDTSGDISGREPVVQLEQLVVLSMPRGTVCLPNCGFVRLELSADEVSRLVVAANAGHEKSRGRAVLVPRRGGTGISALVLGMTLMEDPAGPERTYRVLLRERVNVRLSSASSGIADVVRPPSVCPRGLEIELGLLRITVQNYVSAHPMLVTRCRLDRLAEELEPSSRWESLVDQIAHEVLTSCKARTTYLLQRDASKRIMQVVQGLASLTEAIEPNSNGGANVSSSREDASAVGNSIPNTSTTHHTARAKSESEQPKPSSGSSDTKNQQLPSANQGHTSESNVLRERIIESLPTTLRASATRCLDLIFTSKTEASARKIRFLQACPWLASSRGSLDVPHMQASLDSDHMGHLIVKRELTNMATRISFVQGRGGIPKERPILLVGPPGVGKTSLAASFAAALGRPFASIHMGNISDAVGLIGTHEQFGSSVPGGIMNTMAACGASDPVILLDELDKMGTSTSNGDPVAVLLNLLGGEEHGCFTDSFLGIPFNMQSVIWVATANDATVLPDALLDRLKVLYLEPYEVEEKIEIAKRVLIPRLLQDCCVQATEVSFTQDGLLEIMSDLNGASGMREVEAAVRQALTLAIRDIVAGHVPVHIDHEYLALNS